VFFDYIDNHWFTRTTGMTHFKLMFGLQGMVVFI